MSDDNEKLTNKCSGCGRFTIRRLLVDTKPPTAAEKRNGIKGWEFYRYFFRPWCATLLTRIRMDEIKTPNGVYPMTTVAQVCSRRCVDTVLASWTFNAENVEMRGFGRSRLFKEGDDVFAYVAGEGPPPAEPSDEWIEVTQKGPA